MMRALARPAARAPAVIAFLLASIAAHLVVLRGASVAGWLGLPAHEPAPVTVNLVVPPPAAPAVAAPPATAAATSPRSKPAARRRVRPAQHAAPPPVVAEPAAPATAELPPAASFADSDPFGAALGPAPGDVSGAGQAQAVGRADSAAPAAQAAPAVQVAPAAQTVSQDGVAQAVPPDEAPIAVAPQSGAVRYRVHYGDPQEGNVVATLEHSFEIGPQHYRLHSEGKAKGLVSWFYRGTLVQDSVGTVSAAGLAPSSYRERRGDRPPRSATIDAEHGEVLFGSGQRREAPRGLQDRLSVTVQLALMRQARPAQFEPGATIRLPMLGNSSVEPANWVVIGEETVETDDGALRALRLNRAGAGDDPSVDVWLALDGRVVPVRMRITERTGRALDQVLVSQ